ncbi:MAG: hypothetical protein PWP65_1994 [Clostridia bacterium]|nr:hypothetical protein [Clostridia bacterium]
MDSLTYALMGAFCWGIAPLFGKIALLDVSAAAGLIARTLLAGGLVTPWLIYRGGLGYLLSRLAGRPPYPYLGPCLVPGPCLLHLRRYPIQVAGQNGSLLIRVPSYP